VFKTLVVLSDPIQAQLSELNTANSNTESDALASIEVSNSQLLLPLKIFTSTYEEVVWAPSYSV
jgi:hypothetical protein